MRVSRPLSWLDTSKVPLRNTRGEVIGVLGIYADITELKDVEASLQKTRQRLVRLMLISRLCRRPRRTRRAEACKRRRARLNPDQPERPCPSILC